MEAQKIINVLEESDDDDLKFQTRKWYINNDQINGQYDKGDENDSTIKFDTAVIKPNLCDYSDAYILVTGNIAVVNGNNDTKVCFKTCSSFIRYVKHLNDEHVETAENLDLIMNLYNLIEYSENYEQSSRSLWQYQRDVQNITAARNIGNFNTNDSSSFKYKSSLLEGLTTTDAAANVNPDIAYAHRLFLNAQITVPLKYVHSSDL